MGYDAIFHRPKGGSISYYVIIIKKEEIIERLMDDGALKERIRRRISYIGGL